MLIIGLDDTDMLGTRGTGQLARAIADELAKTYPLLGVTRHQLLVHPDIPCTKNNSCAGVLLDAPAADAQRVLERVEALMLADFIQGSDPGLCVAADVAPADSLSAVTAFGRGHNRKSSPLDDARELAAACGIPLLGLGGDESWYQSARWRRWAWRLCGEDGRYVQVGRSRELSGLQTVAAVLEPGLRPVRTETGRRCWKDDRHRPPAPLRARRAACRRRRMDTASTGSVKLD